MNQKENMLSLLRKNKITMNLDDEPSIIQQAKKDPKYFEPLYKKYYEDIFRFIFQRIGEESDTEEICSDVFYKAMTKLNQFKDQGYSLKVWLFQIARNECITRFRKQKNQRYVQFELEEVLVDMDDDVRNRKDFSEDVVHLLQGLKDEELELIEMKYFEHRPYKEIAEITGMSESNAKVKTHRIIKKLNEKVKGYE